jgi:hypothetical protein
MNADRAVLFLIDDCIASWINGEVYGLSKRTQYRPPELALMNGESGESQAYWSNR